MLFDTLGFYIQVFWKGTI